MSLQPGLRLGSYEILTPLGAGGMGEVYRARDTKLQREVAVKVLPELFAGDADRIVRFQREAHVLASLNHPNIGGIYGFEEAQGVGALVLELVEGPTLADRIDQGPVPVEDALAIARQIAGALEAAHARGIIHRDLKPANIKVRPDGTVKVLDFGLAKALDSAVTAADALATPTRTSPALVTHAGVVLGTAAYMAPEQAKGREVDARADIWAFGCVLYEMLTGRSPFGGESVSEMLASVLKTEPEWHRLPQDLPEGIRRLLTRCLQKDPNRRLQHIGDARIEIDEALDAPSGVEHKAARSPGARERWAWTAAGVFALVAGGLALAMFRPSRPLPEIRLDLAMPATADPFSFAVSPDGQKIVFAAPSAGRPHLWLRMLDSTSARPLPGTEFAASPFWSPDSSSIGFFAEGKLKRFAIESGSIHIVASRAPAPQGATWNAEDTIVFSPNISGQLLRVSVKGGATAPVTQTDAIRSGHRYPHFLPGGRRFLYYIAGNPDVRGIYVGSLEGPGASRIIEADTPAVYTASGHLLFVNQGKLLAQRFDPATLELRGQPRAVAEGVAWELALPGVSASPSGPIVFRSGTTTGRRQQFVLVDRSGKEIEKIGDPHDARAWSPSLSRDGRRVALHRSVNGNTDIWWFDTARAFLTRLTTATTGDIHPLWSPDGAEIIYASNEKGVYDLYRRSVSRPDTAQLVLATPAPKRPVDWSSDGRFLLYLDRGSEQKSGPDIWALPLKEPGKPFPVIETEFDEIHGQFSPDVRWIAYETNKTGRTEIFVRPFPGPGMEWQVSASGGSQVRWRPDGSELFYISLDGQLMAVPVRASADGHTLNAGKPAALFTTHVGGAVQTASLPLYMVPSDGKRFLMLNVLDDTFSSPLTVLLNWKGKP